MRIQNIAALFIKQSKDCARNFPVLLLFFIYPLVALILTRAMADQAGTGDLFTTIFATMHAVFTPLVAASSFIAEEREKNTLRVLIMSNVTLKEYLLSVGGFILLANLITGSAFIFFGNLPAGVFTFILAMGGCSLISIMLGSCIGLFLKNAAAANGIAVPVGIFFAFLPMLANFNEKIEAVANFTYGQQFSKIIAGNRINYAGLIIIGANFAILATMSGLLYKRSLSE